MAADTTTREKAPRGFWPLFFTQFQGAFNDNAYRMIIIYFLLSQAMAKNVAGVTEESVNLSLLGIAMVLFAIPYLVFPALAGTLADRYSKRTIIIATKISELCIMVLGVFAFLTASEPLIWFMLFLMFTQSAFFSPAKYGILPEMLSERRLSWGNGVMSMGTFVAIVSGAAIGGLLYWQFETSIYAASVVLVMLSVMGLATSFFVPKLAPAAPGKPIPINPWSGLGGHFARYVRNRYLWIALVGCTFFWFAGAVAQNNVLTLTKSTLGMNEAMASLMYAIVSLGIGIGAVSCGYLSRNKIEMGLAPLGVAGFALMSILLGLVYLDWSWTGSISLPFIESPLNLAINIPLVIMLFALGFFGGFIEVPLLATIQFRSPKEVRGGMIATYNIMTCVGILGAGLVLLGSGEVGLSPYHIFVGIGAFCLLSLAYVAWAAPAVFLRLLLWIPANTIYRLRVGGRDNIPETGGALLVTSKLSFIDALVMTAAIDRPIRFIFSEELYQTRWIRPLARLMEVITVSSLGGPRDLVRALRQATDTLQEGGLVCVIGRGALDSAGQTLPVQENFERITRDLDVPIIPVHVDETYGPLYIYENGRYQFTFPRDLPFKIWVNFGGQLPVNTPTPDVINAIQELSTATWMERPLRDDLLHRALYRTAWRHPFKFSMVDQRTAKRLSFFKVYIASIAMARKLKTVLGDEEMTGLLLPQSVGSAVTNVALQMMGKVAVNLNYTASPTALASAAEQCKIRQVLTSKEFLRRFPVEVPGEPIWLEEIGKSITTKDRLMAMLIAVTMPIRRIERMLGASPDRNENDLATIIFSSGSEGEPKGVMLTHKNILTNLESVAEAFPHSSKDGMTGILPFFHSFGYMATLWLPLWRGWFVMYHPNPLEPKVIGQLVAEHKPTFLIATPTFLQGFIRRCLPEELASLRYIVTGAEKLPERIREAFKKKFGVEPLEGYGTTECAPAVSVNVTDFIMPGCCRINTRHGTIGRAFPGVSLRVVDPDTGEVMPQGETGVICVKGPNIMKGYLCQPEKTAEVLQDGWYWTGDIARIDEDGFVQITDRLARFSKIGGEMVPHNAIEETLHKMLGLSDQTFAVTSVPDVAKGERLVVLHTLMDGELEEVVDQLNDCDLPNLWRPKATSFYRIKEIPILATGKMDLKEVKKLAKEMDVGE